MTLLRGLLVGVGVGVGVGAGALLVGCSGNRPSTTSTPDAGFGTGDGGEETVSPDAAFVPPPGSTYGGPDAALGPDADKWDAVPPPPQVLNDDGGVLTSPQIVAVFFSNEDQTTLPTLEQVYAGIGASSFWKIGLEYGVGPATAKSVVLSEAAPSTIDDTTDPQGDLTALEQWLLNELASKALPAPTPNTTYMINYPAGTTVTASGTQCTDFDGYHSDLLNPSDNAVYSYGVVPHCDDPGSSYLQTFSATVSHETIEAATDPYPDYYPAWAQADGKHLYFDEANDGSEIADMCENDPQAFYQPSDFPFTVQRIWSNQAALAGHDPCVPAIAGKPYFNAFPELPDTGLYEYYLLNVEVSSVSIPLGGSKTIYVDLYSDGTVPNWDVVVVDYDYFYTGGMVPTLLDVDMPVTSGNNGDRLPVTITVKQAGDPTTNGQVANTELFVVYSSQGLTESAPAHLWYGIVTN